MKKSNDLLIVCGEEVRKILEGEESKIVDLIREAYIAHEEGKSSLPHSTFLRFSDDSSSRIIGLPGYLRAEEEVAGIKWIASFPENLSRGIERASALIILNSIKNGRPYCITEGSIISAKRTAASAIVGAQVMFGVEEPESIGIVGCGPIGFEILRFVVNAFPRLSKASLYDLDGNRARVFSKKAKELGQVECVIESSFEELARDNKFIVFATTAPTPYIEDPSILQPHSKILHISLRDLGPRVIREGLNITDDKDHVNREKTSIHLTASEDGNTDFVFANLGELLLGKKKLQYDDRPIIFSPFGIGILDLQLAHHVYQKALTEKLGTCVQEFLPAQENEE